MFQLNLSNTVLTATFGIPKTTIEESGDMIRILINNIAYFKERFHTLTQHERMMIESSSNREETERKIISSQQQTLQRIENFKKYTQETYQISDVQMEAIEQYLNTKIKLPSTHVQSTPSFLGPTSATS